jgi:hypothetical protein
MCCCQRGSLRPKEEELGVMKSQENVVVGLVVSGRVTDREVAALIQT